MVAGCGDTTKAWVARFKTDHSRLEFGDHYGFPLHCGSLEDRYLNHQSWDFLCAQCAKRAGWLW